MLGSSNYPGSGCASGVYANCYYYDANGNLSAKTDNGGLGVSYRYDALNRTTIKYYFNLPYTVYYRFPTTADSDGFGKHTATTTVTFPLASGGTCPPGWTVIP